MAKLGPDVPGPWHDYSDRLIAHTNTLQALQAEANALPDGELVGALVKFQVADGYAIYRVESTRPLTLAHVPAHDGYSIPAAHIRGLTVADIRALVAQERHWARLIAERSGR